MLTKLYVMEIEGNVTYYGTECDRVYAFNMLVLKKPWLSDKIKKYEINVNDITACLKNNTTINIQIVL